MARKKPDVWTHNDGNEAEDANDLITSPSNVCTHVHQSYSAIVVVILAPIAESLSIPSADKYCVQMSPTFDIIIVEVGCTECAQRTCESSFGSATELKVVEKPTRTQIGNPKTHTETSTGLSMVYTMKNISVNTLQQYIWMLRRTCNDKRCTDKGHIAIHDEQDLYKRKWSLSTPDVPELGRFRVSALA